MRQTESERLRQGREQGRLVVNWILTEAWDKAVPAPATVPILTALAGVRTSPPPGHHSPFKNAEDKRRKGTGTRWSRRQPLPRGEWGRGCVWKFRPLPIDSDPELLRSTIITNLRKDKVDKRWAKPGGKTKATMILTTMKETPEPATGTGLISTPCGRSERMAMCQTGQTGETLSPPEES